MTNYGLIKINGTSLDLTPGRRVAGGAGIKDKMKNI